MSTWIKCSDQMPVNNFSSDEFFVLIKQFTNPVTYATEFVFYDGDYKFGKEPRGWWKFDDDVEPYEVQNVVAWMHKPDMPEDL